MAAAARPKRLDRATIAERQRKVGELYLSHQSQAAIARALGVSQSTVSLDLAALLDEWRRENLERLEAVKTREAAELDVMEAEAARQYATTKTTDWFDRRLKVKIRRAHLLGLDSPARAEVSGPGGGPIPMVTEIIVELPPATARDSAAASAALTDEGETTPLEVVVELPDE